MRRRQTESLLSPLDGAESDDSEDLQKMFDMPLSQ